MSFNHRTHSPTKDRMTGTYSFLCAVKDGCDRDLDVLHVTQLLLISLEFPASEVDLGGGETLVVLRVDDCEHLQDVGLAHRRGLPLLSVGCVEGRLKELDVLGANRIRDLHGMEERRSLSYSFRQTHK
jgi:hypothetical protein